MSSQSIRWIVILVVLVIAVLNPIYRHYSLNKPIVTLGLDLKGGVEVLLQAVPEDGSEVTPDQLDGAREVVQNRIDPQGTKELLLTTVSSDRLLLQVPGEKNPDEVVRTIGDTALLEFINTGEQSFEEGTVFNVEGSADRKPEFVKYETILTGADLSRSDAQIDGQGRPAVGFTFKGGAAETFGQWTNQHVGQYLTILLDGVVLTSPVIKGPIWGGEGVIEGTFTVDEVGRVVRQLNAGALPVPLKILSASIVGPSLGQESIDTSFIAGIVGFGIVLLFMLLFYRLPGLLACISLAMYVMLVLGLLSLINATLTLPGIAGFLLSIGMAIDANIIIFERLKEEIRWGKTLTAALDSAFARAWVAILDGQLTTLLAAAVLYFFGTGPVKGFAVTLFIGNLMALYSGVFVTRTMLNGAVRRMKNPSLYVPVTGKLEVPAERLREGHYIRFVERTALWVSISLVAIVGGIVFMVSNVGRYDAPFNLGIDYTGGEKIILETSEPMPQDGQEVAAIVHKYSQGEATVQVDGGNNNIVSIRMRIIETGESEDQRSQSRTENLLAMKEEIGNAFGGFAESGAEQNPVVMEQNYVGPTVGAELIQNAIWALIIGSILIMIYIFIRFQEWAYSFAAILAILHDVLLTLAVTAALGIEVNASFIAVILTIIGYSINDTIIIFDRIRENRRHFGDSVPIRQLANLSLTQTLSRSIYTVMTVVFMTTTLLVFGGANIRPFMIAMLAGLIAGAYSSIYIATPVMLMLHGRGKKNGAVPALATAGGTGLGTVVEVTPESEGAVEEAINRERTRKQGGAKQKRRR